MCDPTPSLVDRQSWPPRRTQAKACEALGDVVIDAGGAACDFSAESLAALLDTGLEDSYEVVRVQAAAAVGRVAVDALEKEAHEGLGGGG